MTRRALQTAELIAAVAFIAIYLSWIVFVSSYDCFEDHPKVVYSVCAVDFYTARINRAFEWIRSRL